MGLSLSAECLGVSCGKNDLCSLLNAGSLESKGKVVRVREIATLLGKGWWVSLDEEGSRCVGVNRPSLSQLDRAKREFSARFSDFDLQKAALPNK